MQLPCSTFRETGSFYLKETEAFKRQTDEVAAINLASLSGLFDTFKYEINSRCSKKTPPVFHVDWAFFMAKLTHIFRSVSGFGRCLHWEVDNVVELVQIYGK